VLAACTPAGLRDQMHKLPDDGLIQRFMPCLMSAPSAPEAGTAREALREWGIVLREIFERTKCAEQRARLRLSVDASAAFDSERSAIRAAVDSLYDLSPSLASHVGKHPGMLARVALTFHVIDGRKGEGIERDTMEGAARFMHKVRRHAAALYLGILSTSQSLEVARGVARAIAADLKRPAGIGRHYMVHGCRAFRDAEDPERRLAVQSLEDARWLAPVPGSRSYGGWGASEWAVNSACSSCSPPRARRIGQGARLCASLSWGVRQMPDGLGRANVWHLCLGRVRSIEKRGVGLPLPLMRARQTCQR